MIKTVDVLVVGDEGDPHVVAVERAVVQSGQTVLRMNLSDVRTDVAVADPRGVFRVWRNGQEFDITSSTSVWWYRAGSVDTDGLGADEARLAAEEAFDFLVGALAAVGVRWVDEPSAVRRAELKLLQLAVASALGVPAPQTWVTDNVDVARQALDSHRLVAKALSSGIGIAPHVAEFGSDDLAAIAELPVMMQELVQSTSDVRVVNIGEAVWGWRRARGVGVTDWRAVDPSGVDFERIDAGSISESALAITAGLGLTMSVQDWLETDAGFVFLEANPQGAWMFLDGASEEVAPAIAALLVGGDIEDQGTWPRAIKRFLWDFLPASTAPDNDGVAAPKLARPTWTAGVRTSATALEAARRAHDQAKASAAAAEAKAARLAQNALALVAVAVGLGAFQLNVALDRAWPWLLSLVPVGAAVIFLSLAAFEAIEIDRVGMYAHPNLRELAQEPLTDPVRVLMLEEERGRQLASWTSRNKHSDLMQARAWFSRGLAALLLAAVLAGVVRAAVGPQATGASDPVHSPSVVPLPATTPTPAASVAPTPTPIPTGPVSPTPSLPASPTGRPSQSP